MNTEKEQIEFGRLLIKIIKDNFLHEEEKEEKAPPVCDECEDDCGDDEIDLEEFCDAQRVFNDYFHRKIAEGMEKTEKYHQYVLAESSKFTNEKLSARLDDIEKAIRSIDSVVGLQIDRIESLNNKLNFHLMKYMVKK